MDVFSRAAPRVGYHQLMRQSVRNPPSELPMRMHRPALLLLTLATSLNLAAQTTRSEPKPEDPFRAILAAYDNYRIVAIGDYHGTKDLNDFVLALVRRPEFPSVVNDIVVEGTNSFLQPLLDRYIAGEAVSYEDARQLWREGNLPDGANEFQAHLFQLVRRINLGLPASKRLRVVAGEPPVNWPVVTPTIYHDDYLAHREGHIASVLEDEVMAKHRTALMFYGGAHVAHGVRKPEPGWGMAMEYFESKHPGVAFVVTPYVGATAGRLPCGAPAKTGNVDVDARMSSWPVPSLARVKDTWLSDLTARRNSLPPGVAGRPGLQSLAGVDPADAVLYLGPPRLLLAQLPSVITFADTAYLTMLRDRQELSTGDGYKVRLNADSVAHRDQDVMRCQQ